jgi:hypothetical protein
MLQGAFNALKAQQQFTALCGRLVCHYPLHDVGWDTNKAVLRRWRITLRKAKVRYRNVYQTRHTFASTLPSAGVNPLYVAKQMGHRDTEMINPITAAGLGKETARKRSTSPLNFSPKFGQSWKGLNRNRMNTASSSSGNQVRFLDPAPTQSFAGRHCPIEINGLQIGGGLQEPQFSPASVYPGGSPIGGFAHAAVVTAARVKRNARPRLVQEFDLTSVQLINIR